MLKGVIPVVPTPLNGDESIDFAGLNQLIKFYSQNGCHGLLVLGSGGEFPYFSLQERFQIVRAACESNQDRLPLIAGCGFYSLGEALEFIKGIENLPLNGLLVALPTYYKPEFEDVLKYYETISEASPWPVLYYHYPQMTGLFLSIEQMKRIFRIKNISGTKVSSLCLKEMRSFVEISEEKDFDLFAGVSFLMKETIEIGGSGVICPVASIVPQLVVDCYNAYKNGEKLYAIELQKKINRLILITNTFSIPANIQVFAFKILSRLPWPVKNIGTAQRHAVTKEALRLKGIQISASVKTPLLQLRAEDKLKLELQLKKLKL
jgi:dihydrodipicolinate synthase/N-acetylneuraminate lyase